MTYKCIGTCECPKGISPMNEHGEKNQSINLAVEKSQLEKAIQILAKKCWKSAISSYRLTFVLSRILQAIWMFMYAYFWFTHWD